MDEELKGLLVAIGGKLDVMDRKIDAIDQRVGAIDQRVGAIERKIDVIEHDIAVMKQDIADLKTGQAVFSARLDEQRGFLAQMGGTLNALIPTRLAAVPPPAAE